MRKLMKKCVFMVAMVGLLMAGPLFAQQMMALVNVNTADEATLETLEQIGRVKAQAIVQYRQENGPFKTVDDLKKVRGIGDKVFETIRTKVTVGNGQ